MLVNVCLLLLLIAVRAGAAVSQTPSACQQGLETLIAEWKAAGELKTAQGKTDTIAAAKRYLAKYAGCEGDYKFAAEIALNRILVAEEGMGCDRAKIAAAQHAYEEKLEDEFGPPEEEEALLLGEEFIKKFGHCKLAENFKDRLSEDLPKLREHVDFIQEIKYAKWTPLSFADDGEHRHFVDANTMTRSGDTVVFNLRHKYGPTVGYEKLKGDCGRRRLSPLFSIEPIYDPKDTNFWINQIRSDPEQAKEGTVAAGYLIYACKNATVK